LGLRKEENAVVVVVVVVVVGRVPRLNPANGSLISRIEPRNPAYEKTIPQMYIPFGSYPRSLVDWACYLCCLNHCLDLTISIDQQSQHSHVSRGCNGCNRNAFAYRDRP